MNPLKIPVTLALAILIAAMGAGYFLEDRYHTITAARAGQAAHDTAQARDVAALVLAQAVSAAELTRDIEALRLQNVTMELDAIDARRDAGRAFPTDARRRDQLLAQMKAIIEKLER